MGWLNRFSVFTAGLPPSAHFNLSNNKRWTEELGVSQTMDEFFIKWLNWVASGTIFIHWCLFRGLPLKSEWYNKSRGLYWEGFPHPVLAKTQYDQRIMMYMSDSYYNNLYNSTYFLDLYHRLKMDNMSTPLKWSQCVSITPWWLAAVKVINRASSMLTDGPNWR